VTACTGDLPSSSGITVNGFYSDAPVDNATCTLYKTNGVSIAQPSVSNRGQVQFNDLIHTGAAYMECVGGNYVDDATGNTIDLTNVTMRSVSNITDTVDNSIVVTPLTEIAFLRANEDGDLGDYEASLTDVADEFGLDGINLGETRPAVLDLITGSTSDEDRYGIALVAISQIINNSNINTLTFIQQTVTDLADDALEIAELEQALIDITTNPNTAATITDTSAIVSIVGESDGSNPIIASPEIVNASARSYIERADIATLSLVNTGGGALSSCTADSLPAGLSVAVSSDSSTCEITGAPTAPQLETSYTITATNSAGRDTATVSIAIAVASPVVSNPSPQSYPENVAIATLSLTNTGGSELSSCEADSLPDGLSLAVSADSTTCEITGTPTTVQSATTYAITVTNATGSVTATVSITVVVAAPVIVNVSAQSYTENTAITTLSLTNTGGGELSSCAANSLPAGLSVAVSADSTTCEITGTPTTTQSVTIHTITATNATGSNIATVIIEVVVAPPVIENATAQNYTENTVITTLSLLNTGGAALRSCEADNLPDGLSVAVSSDSTTCEITGTPTTAQSATTHTITAVNATGSDTATVDITVAVALPVVADAAAQSYTEDTAIATLSFANTGGAALSSCTGSLPAGLSVAVSADSTTCEITGTPTTAQSATTHTITATNATGSDTADVSISVAVAAPVIADAAAQSYIEDTAIATLSLTSTGGGALSSCTGGLPTGLSVAVSGDSTTCEITGTPTVLQSATTHTITATNATGSDTADVSITVAVALPVIADAAAQSYTENTAIATLSLTNTGGGALSSCTGSLPTGLSVAVSGDSTTCEITGTPTVPQSATTHTITATNATGSDTADVSITVAVALPVIADAAAQSYTENTAIATLSLTNTGGGTLSSCTGSLPTGLSVAVSGDSTTCEITGTPTVPQSATTHTITATNATGSDTADVSITVAGIAPVIADAAAQSYTENTAIATLSLSNTGGGTLTSCTGSLPAGLSVAVSGDSRACEITGTPTAPQSATTHTITATNATGSDTADVDITVTGIAPVIADAAAQSYTENTAIATLSLSNTGGGTLTSCTGSLPAGLSVAVSGDSTTCEITGTPTAPQSATTHTITATNATGSDTADVGITVTGIAPVIADAAAQTYTEDTTIATLSFTNTGGGTLTSCTGSLPTGLSVAVSGDSTTCEITGTPTVPQSATTHTITATNAIGSDTADVSIEVRGVATLSLLYGQVKEFEFSWNAISANHYNLLENPDGSSGFGEVYNVSVGTESYNHVVPLSARVNAQYILQTCYSADNSDCLDSATVSVSGTLIGSIGYFKASNTEASDDFGRAISLSDDGSTLAIGATAEDSTATGVGGLETNGADGSGAVYVFSLSGSTWTQQEYLKASNTEAGDDFGRAVSLSDDGNTLAVGATAEDSSATGIGGLETNGADDSGAVYVFTRSGSTWTQQEYLKASNTEAGDDFGRAVSLNGDGNTLAVGATAEDNSATGIGGADANGAAESGAVYVFTRSGSTWTQQEYLKASNTEAGDDFGRAISLSDDGNTLAVGATAEDNSATGIGGADANGAAESGAVYVFTRSGSTWTQQEYLKASNTEAGDDFGRAISLSDDGNTLAVGAVAEDSSATGIGGAETNGADGSGAVYVFTRSGSTWAQQEYLKASNTEAGDDFGRAVSLSDDGNTLAVGATAEDSSATGIGGAEANGADASGAVYVFTRSGSTWTQQEYLKASNTEAADDFGRAVSLNGDASTLSVGATAEGSDATGIEGNQTNNDALSSGAVYLY